MTARPPAVSARVRRTAPALIDLVGRACAERRATGGRVFPLAQAVPDFPPPPQVREALRACLADEATHRYTVDPGLLELREAIASVLGGRRGVVWDASQQIVVTAGANLAFAEVLPTLVDPGDEVLLLSPYYLNHGMAIELAGRVRGGGRARSGARLRRRLRRAGALAHRPLAGPGGRQPGQPDRLRDRARSEMERLLAFAAAHDLWLVSDETYEDFVFAPRRTAGPAPRACLVTRNASWCSAASRSPPPFRDGESAGSRGPPRSMHEVMKAHDTMIICAPVAGQRGALASLRGDRAWLEPLRAELAARRRAVLEFLAHSATLEAAEAASRGAMFVLVRPRERPLADSTRTALEIVRTTGVALVPGAAFGRCGEGWLRLSFAGASTTVLEEALPALESAFA